MVYHILKDGTVKRDITGHVVKIEDAVQVYDIAQKMSARRKTKEDKKVS